MGKSAKQATELFQRMTPVVTRVTESNEEDLFDIPVSSTSGPSKMKTHIRTRVSLRFGRCWNTKIPDVYSTGLAH